MSTRGRRYAVLIGAAVLALAAGAGVQLWRQSAQVDPAAVTSILAARWPDLEGTPRALGDWRGQVLVVNYWATWCVPCREEMPIFVKMQAKYREKGLIFVGVAIDQPAKAAAFAKELGINYPILIGSLVSIEQTKAVGNRVSALPFTLVFDRQGRLVANHLGGITEQQLDAIVSGLL